MSLREDALKVAADEEAARTVRRTAKFKTAVANILHVPEPTEITIENGLPSCMIENMQFEYYFIDEELTLKSIDGVPCYFQVCNLATLAAALTCHKECQVVKAELAKDDRGFFARVWRFLTRNSN